MTTNTYRQNEIKSQQSALLYGVEEIDDASKPMTKQRNTAKQ
jgi:hypothetical protein